MNLYGIRNKFDEIMRSYDESDMTSHRDGWINDASLALSQEFLISALRRTLTFDSVVDQQAYLFPYDYGGTEVKLYLNNARLDPVPEHILALANERRTGNMGPVEYYDWSDIQGIDPLATITGALVTNQSTTVLCADAAAAHVDKWIRFDPVLVGGDMIDPGDYGYLVSSIVAGVSYTLDREYRGPTCTTTGQVQPQETQGFICYGIPSAVEEFKLTYYAKPRRLYNNTDVPEWPDLGLPMAFLAASIGLDFLMRHDSARVWWGRAQQAMRRLQLRRINSQTELVSDLTIGSVSGRRTGMRGVWTSSSRRGR